MKNLTEAGSTQAPAYLALCKLGYKVYREVNEDLQYEMWYAENGTIRLSAGDVLILLGLHTVWEYRVGDVWQSSPEATAEFIEKFPLVDYSKESEGGREFECGDNDLWNTECGSMSIRIINGGQCEAFGKCLNPAKFNIMMATNELDLCYEHMLRLKDLICLVEQSEKQNSANKT